MMSKIDWKAREESLEAYADPGDGFVIVRVDGRAFRTLTKGMEKPFDVAMTAAMDSSALYAARSIPGVSFAYVQSDEISVFVRTPGDVPDCVPYSGRVEKLASVVASCATAGFLSSMPDPPEVPAFDGRVIAASVDEAADYMGWRMRDAEKNAISAAALAVFGHDALLGVGTPERLAMLRGTEWDEIPDGLRYGRRVMREDSEVRASWSDASGRHETMCVRHPWKVRPMSPELAADTLKRFL